LSPFESGPSFVMFASVLTLELVLLAWIGSTTTAAHASTAKIQRRLIVYPLKHRREALVLRSGDYTSASVQEPGRAAV
jgi:hypothetical protein